VLRFKGRRLELPLPEQRSADVTKKREALEELLQSDGWQYLRVHVLLEWRGTGYAARIGTALQTKDLVDVQVVHKTALEMVRLLEWPVNQVRELKGSTGDE
jgi:hypothetical protein